MAESNSDKGTQARRSCGLSPEPSSLCFRGLWNWTQWPFEKKKWLWVEGREDVCGMRIKGAKNIDSSINNDYDIANCHYELICKFKKIDLF